MLPSHERARIRKRIRSPEMMAKIRENVVGPEEVREEMEQNEAMAELRFQLETEIVVHEALRQTIDKNMKEAGIEEVLDVINPSESLQAILDDGNFDVRVESSDDSSDQLVIHPEGNVSEKIAIKPSYSEQYVSQFQSSDETT